MLVLLFAISSPNSSLQVMFPWVSYTQEVLTALPQRQASFGRGDLMMTPIMPLGFWDELQQIVDDHHVVIDRPRGTAHPRYPDFIYPLDYGYLEGATAQDGGGVDVWVGSMSNQGITGICCVADWHKRDAEIKILIECTEEEQQIVLKKHSEASMRGMLVNRSGETTLWYVAPGSSHELAPPQKASCYWGLLDLFVESHQLVIEKPQGSAQLHCPALVSHLDYGYLAGTEAASGSPIDIWVGSDCRLGMVGVCVIPDCGSGQIEMKLLIGCTAADMDIVRRVHKQGLLLQRKTCTK